MKTLFTGQVTEDDIFIGYKLNLREYDLYFIGRNRLGVVSFLK